MHTGQISIARIRTTTKAQREYGNVGLFADKNDSLSLTHFVLCGPCIGQISVDHISVPRTEAYHESGNVGFFAYKMTQFIFYKVTYPC